LIGAFLVSTVFTGCYAHSRYYSSSYSYYEPACVEEVVYVEEPVVYRSYGHYYGPHCY